MSTAEEILKLDMLTLREHTERAGDRLDPEVHALQLSESMRISRVCSVRRCGDLVAYAMLSQTSGSSWFVRGFNTHPADRNFSVLRELFKAVGDVVDAEGISEIRSNVYKTNRLSMAFHRKLGFQITNENAKGVEFFATVSGLMANPTFQRTATRPLN